MRLTVWQRFAHRLGKPGDGGDWDPDSGRTHAVENGRTLCGVGVPSSAACKGQWEQTTARYADESFVDCRRCRSSLAK